MKVPPHLWDSTVAFYRDVLKQKVVEEGVAKSSGTPYICFQFGENQLWIDRVSSVSQAEVWLEIKTNDIDAASETLKKAGVVRRDEIEKLPGEMQAFWIQNPASIIHLVSL